MRALQKAQPCDHTYTCKGRKSVSVGSVCVSGEPWLELLANCFLLLLLLTLHRVSASDMAQFGEHPNDPEEAPPLC